MCNKVLLVAVAVLLVANAIGEKSDDTKSARSDKASHYQVLGKVSVPGLINYQGHLTDVEGKPITDTLEMTFSIWDAASGGSQLWDETQTSVSVVNGLFNVLLGSVNPIPTAIFTGAPRWLQTQVGAEILSPRKEIVSVGYAYYADRADTAGYSFNAARTDTADYAASALFADSSSTAEHATYADSSGTTGRAAYADSAGIAGYAHDVSHAETSDYSVYADSAGVAGSAAYADSAGTTGYAQNAKYADTSSYALHTQYAARADTTNFAWLALDTVVCADSANVAAFAYEAGHAGTSNYADSAGVAAQARNAVNAGNSDAAAYSDSAGYAHDADKLDDHDSNYFATTTHNHDADYVNEGQTNAITSDMIVNGAVESADLAVGAVTTLRIASGAVTSAKIVNGAVTSAKILDGTIQEADLSFTPGDITAVNAGDGLNGGGSSGDVTLTVDVTDFAGDGLGEDTKKANNLKVNTGTGLTIIADAVKLQTNYETGSAYDSRFVNEGQANSITSVMIVNGTVQQEDLSFSVPDGHSLDAADGSPTDAVYVDNDGNVGIGTTASPDIALDVNGAVRVDNEIQVTTGGTAADPAYTFSGDGNTGMFHGNMDELAFTAGGVQTVRIESGQVGVNTIDPIGALDVRGTGDIILNSSGNVGIGMTTPNYKLDVAGDINTTGDIRKNGTAYNNPDYVFEPEYDLMSLKDLKEFIAKEKHLPNMPSTEEVKKEGVKLFEQNRLLLEKVEEAYLYIIELEERITKLEEEVKQNVEE